jgi:putative hemolysin
MDILTLAAVFFVLSIFFSGMEIAYTSFDRIVLEGWKRTGRVGVQAIEFLISRPDRFLMTTLIGTNLSNVAYATLIVIWSESVGLSPVWVLIGSPLLVLLLAEILPKLVGFAAANVCVRLGAYPLLISHRLFLPLRWLLRPIADTAMRLPSSRGDQNDREHIRREIDHILSEAEAEGALNENEGELLDRYLKARDIRVREIMTPRTKMIALSDNSSVAEAVTIFAKHRLNILPVYHDDLDHIIGCLRAQDLFQPRASIAELIHPISAIPETKRIVNLLEQFKIDDLRVAIVVDEHGGTDGIISLRDIISALVGPVTELWDSERHKIKRIAPGKYLVTGSVSRDELEAKTGWRFPDGEFTTLSGWLTFELEHIPVSGEQIESNGVTVRALAASPMQVEACLISLPKTQTNGKSDT